MNQFSPVQRKKMALISSICEGMIELDKNFLNLVGELSSSKENEILIQKFNVNLNGLLSVAKALMADLNSRGEYE